MKRKANERVMASIASFTKLIGDYKEFPLQGAINLGRVHEIIEDLEISDYVSLRAELNKLNKDKSISEVCFDSAREILSAARLDQSFSGVSPRMGEWYDNEVRTASHDPTPPKKVIDRIFELIAIVEKQVKKLSKSK